MNEGPNWSPLSLLVEKGLVLFSLFGFALIGLAVLCITLWAAKGKFGLLSGGIVGAGCMTIEYFILNGTGLRAESAASKSELTWALYMTMAICLISLIAYIVLGLKIANAHRAKTGTG
jgi:hypothetical protein